MTAVLTLKNVKRTYKQGPRVVKVLQGVDLTLKAGEIVGLIGPSGAGKSTLLHAAGLLEQPDVGEVNILGTPTRKLSDNERTRIRREHIGFVYQFHHLLPEFSALENVAMPGRIAGDSAAVANARAEALLSELGLKNRLSHRPAELSGGEQQRVAIARAIANKPALLLADEPTGNLDEATASRVMEAFVALARGEGVAALVATHNMELAGRLDRVVTLKDGIMQDL